MKLPKPKLDILKESKEDLSEKHSSGKEEDRETDSDDNNNDEKSKDDCKPSFFGVRSYVHHFYEPISANDGFKSDSEEVDEAR